MLKMPGVIGQVRVSAQEIANYRIGTERFLPWTEKELSDLE